MSKCNLIAVDLAKDVFQVAIAGPRGNAHTHLRLTRKKFEQFLAETDGAIVLIIHRARSVLVRAKTLDRSGKPLNRIQRWALRLDKRVGHNKATVALANKMARMCWAVWKHRTPLDPGPALS